MSKVLYIIFISLFSLTVFSCAKKSSSDGGSSTTSTTSDDDDTTNDGTITLSSSLAYIDVTDAESLLIVPGSSSSRSVSRSSFASSTTNTLFKMTETGAVEEVEYKDADNNTYTVTSQPVSIDKVDSNYIVLIF